MAAIHSHRGLRGMLLEVYKAAGDGLRQSSLLRGAVWLPPRCWPNSDSFEGLPGGPPHLLQEQLFALENLNTRRKLSF